MKPLQPNPPHHALVQAYAALNHQHYIALPAPMSHAQAGLPLASVGGAAHPRGHLWTGLPVYHAPALGMTHHIALGDLHGTYNGPPKNVRGSA